MTRIFPPKVETNDRGHGRIEYRSIRTSTALKGCTKFPYVEQVFEIERITHNLDGELMRHETIVGVTSLTPEKADAMSLLMMNRGHWSIENSLHYVRDVTFDEDRSQVRVNNGPQVMASLRNVAISLIRLSRLGSVASALRSFGRKAERALQFMGI